MGKGHHQQRNQQRFLSSREEGLPSRACFMFSVNNKDASKTGKMCAKEKRERNEISKEARSQKTV